MKKIIETVISIWFKLLGQLPKKNLVYFESFHGKQFSDNPKAIYDYLKKEDTTLELVWGVTRGYEETFIEKKVPYISRFSLRWFFVMPRAKYWVINTRTPLWLSKNKHTTYIQTWHGTPLKRIGVDIEEVNIPGYTKESYDQEFLEESKRWDYLTSSSDYTTQHFNQAFGYTGQMISKGFPRNDQLVNREQYKEKIGKLRASLGIKTDKKIILYAPTWRETDHKTADGYEFSIDFPYEEFLKTCGEEMVLLVRMHYLVAQTLDTSTWPKDKLIDVSLGYDMSDLLLMSDVLITDYSSCMFDFSLTNRPMLFFMPDSTQYEEDIRGFYQPIQSLLPGPVIKEQHKVIEQLQNLDTLDYEKEYQQFKQTFCNNETGTSAQVVAEIIKKEMSEQT
ncbi:CDP-glycerol glycerophosphotransferase family protein [Vagococcus bubulae]|uniref:CDP-glycerol--glycerophosphate glycerophosphotransferase n=1 Tax=Vagococcus bubulae TaxID=1977868 RepID=A0A429ZM75_9ENTE|nr:CDP-glycerol glycerophosphotransferase family protein [Vagococcus bubulae]RST94791.1 hypothetical protein CBF36_04485 [Vagococcus bubulae]